MSVLRRGLLAATSVTLFVSMAAADVKSDARDLAAMWQPAEVRVENSRLTLVLPQRRITEEIYLAILTSGLCLGPIVGKLLPGVSEIHVLNEFARQGYVYEKGLEDCDRFNNRPVGDGMTRMEILGATHLY